MRFGKNQYELDGEEGLSYPVLESRAAAWEELALEVAARWDDFSDYPDYRRDWLRRVTELDTAMKEQELTRLRTALEELRDLPLKRGSDLHDVSKLGVEVSETARAALTKENEK